MQKKPSGNVLEIGCGPGNLTIGLLEKNLFKSITASDISLNFMRILNNRHARIGSETTLYKALFDANKLPFEDEQFDFVIGNSVLHHFANFEKTLEETKRILLPGGTAIFGEPIIDTYAFVSLVAGIMVRNFDKYPDQAPSEKALQILKALQTKTARKMNHLYGDRSELADIEDKFQFPVEYLRSIAEELGYSRFHVRRMENLNFGQNVRRGIIRSLQLRGEPTDFVDQFDYIFSALTQDYGKPLQKQLNPLLNHVAFVK